MKVPQIKIGDRVKSKVNPSGIVYKVLFIHNDGTLTVGMDDGQEFSNIAPNDMRLVEMDIQSIADMTKIPLQKLHELVNLRSKYAIRMLKNPTQMTLDAITILNQEIIKILIPEK